MVRVAIEEAREQVAHLVGCRAREVVFTSGATEAVNAAVWGVMARAAPDAAIALAAVEHSAVRDASSRHPAVPVPVDGYGRLDLAALMTALGGERRERPVALVQCQWGNQEVGTLQPIEDVIAACRDAGTLVHVDAAQAVGHVPVDFAALGADLLSLSGHKFGGPLGTGALIVRRGLRIAPMLVGGDQERARRAGIENVPAICALGAAAAELSAATPGGGRRLDEERASAIELTTRLSAALTAVAGVRVFGDPRPEGRLPHLVCFGIDGVEAEGVLLGLDQAGIAAHSGSACSSEALEPSPVLEAMGVDADHSLRLSVGWNTTAADVDATIEAFPRVVAHLRSLADRPAGSAAAGDGRS
jgi:cysteine desulfurase